MMYPLDFFGDLIKDKKDKQLNNRIEYNKLLIQNSNLAGENGRLEARIIDFENKFKKINNKFLILPDKTLIRKENIIAVTQSFTEMEYYIVIDMNREGFVKSFNYGKDKKLMQKDYNSIIEQLQYKEDF